ncbi:MAG TPA: hypothetical protein VKB45_17715 [Gemmatimonadales bacterium]|nr:hypothetical protein [Gemmatimonadales bacterium]
MKSAWSVLALLAATTSAAAQQTAPQPTLILSIMGGVSNSSSLWDIERQPLCVLLGQSCSNTYDTLRVTRDVTPGIVAGVMGTLFRGPHVGLSLEVLYIGMPLDDTCTRVDSVADPGADPVYGSRNGQLCLNISGASLSTSIISVMGGVVVRAAPRGSFSPYVRAGVGITSYSTSTTDLSGAFVQNGNLESRAVVVDPHPKSVGISGQFAAGFTEKLGPGYQFRLEVQDALLPLQRLIGPANDLAQAPRSTEVLHRLSLRFGLDVVLEQKRGRRY